MAPDNYRLSIDFGTSTTAAALQDSNGRIEHLLFDASTLLPSAVWAGSGPRVLVGNDAIRAAVSEPGGLETTIKRCIDDGTVLLGARDYPVAHLIGSVLRRVNEAACRAKGKPPAQVVLTHPATWATPRLQVLTDAARLAGLNDVTLVSEPVAAAAFYATTMDREIPTNSSIVIYDFGAGTFDVSVVRKSTSGYLVEAHDGADDAGGLDLDAVIVDFARERTWNTTELWARLDSPRDTADRRARRELWVAARAVKETLSRSPTALLHVPIVDVDLHLTRDEFEKLATPLLERVTALTLTTVRSASKSLDGIVAVLLVGGSSRIPLAATLLHRALGMPAIVREQPELVVSSGALSVQDRISSTLCPPVAIEIQAPTMDIGIVEAEPVQREALESATPQPSRRVTAPPHWLDSIDTRKPIVAMGMPDRPEGLRGEVPAFVVTLALWLLLAGSFALLHWKVSNAIGLLIAGAGVAAAIALIASILPGNDDFALYARLGLLGSAVILALIMVAAVVKFVSRGIHGSAANWWLAAWFLAASACYVAAIFQATMIMVVLDVAEKVRKQILSSQKTLQRARRHRWFGGHDGNGKWLSSLSKIPAARFFALSATAFRYAVASGRVVVLFTTLPWGAGRYERDENVAQILRNGHRFTAGTAKVERLARDARRLSAYVKNATVHAIIVIVNNDGTSNGIEADIAHDSGLHLVTLDLCTDIAGGLLATEPYQIDIEVVSALIELSERNKLYKRSFGRRTVSH